VVDEAVEELVDEAVEECLAEDETLDACGASHVLVTIFRTKLFLQAVH